VRSRRLTRVGAIFIKGLWIDQSDYDWTPRPVIRLSLKDVSSDSVARLKSDLYTSVKDIADREGVKFNGESPGRCFRQLIEALYSKYGRKPVVLIDEYDAPILS
jgi:hypothetical protein